MNMLMKKKHRDSTGMSLLDRLLKYTLGDMARFNKNALKPRKQATHHRSTIAPALSPGANYHQIRFFSERP
jgi:hypothetical protein